VKEAVEESEEEVIEESEEEEVIEETEEETVEESEEETVVVEGPIVKPSPVGPKVLPGKKRGGGKAPDPPDYKDFIYRLEGERRRQMERWLDKAMKQLKTTDLADAHYEALRRWQGEVEHG
jgi:hypothetical protein